MIRLQDALDIMKNGEPFSISFVTANKSKKTGGEILELENVKLNKFQKQVVKNIESIPKPANETANEIRNFLLPNGQIRKCHIRLITKFNGQPVVY